jgi:hypothetical protein
MANLQLPRASPPEGFSIARKVMDDAAAHYLAHGGPAVARIELANLANGLKFYNDYMEAYQAALEKVAQAEAMEHQKRLQEFADLMHPKKKTAQSAESSEPVVLPPKLSTEKAMLMWKLLQQAGYIDDDYQPIGLSRTELAILAYDMSKRLGIRDKWKTFEKLWDKKNLRNDYNEAMNQRKSLEFREKLKLLFADIQRVTAKRTPYA